MAPAVAAPFEWRDVLPYNTSKDSSTVHNIEGTTDGENEQGGFGFWDTCVHQVIREHCQRSPDSPAVNAWDGSFTYAELDSLSDGIASVLILLGVKPECIIPICMQKSRWTTVAILGVLKSGGAFTLLDPSYPRSRLEEICTEIQARFILTSEELGKQCFEMSPVLVVEHLSLACLLSPGQAVQTPSRPENAAYVAFTSGSTGKPKGIVIEHRSYCSGARSHLKVFGINSTSRVLQFASYAFDVSIMETLSTLMAGGCLCVMSESERSDPSFFVESYKNFRISHSFMTPSFARTVPWTECCSPSTTLIVGGELMRPSDAIAYEAMGIRCMNAYGPAECSVNVSVQSRVEDGVDPRNIGYTTGATAWIVSPEDPEQLMPPGTVGELLVEGPIVGRGYLNDPSATRQAFVDTPAWLRRHRKGTGYQHRVYRTGDLASQDSISGALLLHGRKDAQVKIRGQRVELPEIEQHLQQTFPNGDAEVIVEKVTFSEDGVEKLIAFILIRPFSTGFITDNMGDRLFLAPQSQIMEQFAISKQHLQTNLPSYMIPDIFIPISTVPQTASGKTDRRALRTRAAALSRREVQCFLLSPTGDKRPPSTPKESTIRSLYSNVLNLPIDLIGMDDTFLRLGGDSLQAIRLAAAARTAGLILHAKDILSSQSTLAEQSKRAGLIQTSGHAGEPSTPFALLPVAKRHDIVDLAQKQCRVSSKLIEDVYPCTALQESMFLTSLRHPGMYTGQIAFDIPDRVELPRLRAAWLSVMSKNAALRTRIIETHEGLMQAVIVDDFEWEEETNEMLPGRREALEITKIGVPLVRFRYRPRHGQLIMTIHHSIWDGWSLRLVHEQLQRAYIGRDPLPSTSYHSFIQYTQDLPGADEFWASELAGVNAPIFPTLPSGNYRPYVTASHRHVVRNLVSTGREEHTTATYIHLAWSLLIAHYTDADETVYGVTINGRSADVPGIENIVGPTIATVPLRIRVNQEDTVKMALDQVQDSLARMIPYEQAGLHRISRCSKDASEGCRFQTLLIIEAPADRDVACEKNEAGNFSIIRGTTQTGMDYTAFSSYAMMLIFRTSADKSAVTFDITHDPQVIGSVEVERMAHQFEHVLRHIYKPATERIGNVSFLGPRDIEQVQQWNNNMPPADNRFLQELIFAQCSRRPQASAIVSWDGSWTYQELWTHSSFVARQLQRYGVKRGTPVAVCLDRSRWSIAVILAVLLAEGTCVLIDLLSPRQRVRDILQIVGADILVNSHASAPVTSGLCPTVIDVSLLAAQNDYSQTEYPSNLDAWERGVGTPEDLAFIMFTSGSTGRPKGIEMPHRTLSTSIYHHSAGMKVKSSSRVLHFSSYAFDVSIYEIFTTLTAGGTIYVPSEFDRMNNLAGFIRDTQVNWAFLTPSTARSLDPADVPLLTTLVLGGEAVTHESVETWAKGRSLINGYGPAEATICGVGDIHETGWKSGVIGQIVGGLGWVTVPSDPTRLAAVGAVGELLLEGPFLARGYLNLPEVTRAAFIDPPSWRTQIPAPSPYPFLYRTGDLVRYQPDGSIQYIGRKDGRVKLRGQLVDLNAVEASVMRVYPAATQVVADVLVSDNTARLIVLMKLGPPVAETHDDHMFETPDFAFNEAAASIQACLRAIVPPYMVPSMFIPLRHIPRTLTGKTDRRQLRDKLLSFSQSDLQHYIMSSSAKTPMSDDNERSLQEIWAEVLRLPCEAIGREDSFLLLGGESLATIKMVASARRVGFVFSVEDVLNNMSLSTLARSRHLITEHDTPSPSPSLSLSTIESQSLQGILRPLQNGGLIQGDNDIVAVHPVTAAQAFLVQRYPWSHFQFDLSGDISLGKLQTACTALMARFTILRTVFIEHADHLLQLVLREVRECVHEITTDEPLDDFCESLCQQQQGVCVVSSTALPTLFTLVSNRQLNTRRLLLRLAHAQYDLTTIPLIVQALADEYNRTPRASFSSDFHDYLSHRMRQTNDDRAHTFWNQYLSGSSMTPTYPTANTTTPQKPIFQVTGSCTVTPASHPPGITTATAVKAAVCLVLASRTGGTDIVIGQTVDARCSSADSTLDQIVGPCTNYIPYRLSVCNSQIALEYLRSAQAQHTTSLRYSSLDLDQIVTKCTSWPSSTQFGYIVQHQNTDADLALSLGSGSTSSPMTSYGRVFPQGEVWIGSTPLSTGLKIDVIALSAVLSQEDAQAMAEEVGAALENLLGCGDRPLSDLTGNTFAG
ncbi:Nonribosomal peptide synthetase 13 [Hirsutella minnesotensis 3608]|uniref:Brevianamide F synthase n=1 Tax=Hirsutella minnesotensis 3608 TaxID=1043627 RepID=A0A0F7ZVE1_9HYPO|nr:Nonribosomal peptide synthetase 13 [Hirsutella minnesotensis 3608]